MGSGVNPSTSASQYGFKVASADATTSLADAITSNHYFEFSLTASSGYEITIDSLSISGEATSTGADNVALLSSVGGFNDSSIIASASGIAGATGGLDSDGSGFGTISLSGDAAYDGLASVIFRIYGWNTSSSSGAGVTRIRNLSGNDLVIEGAVSLVPEPNTYAMLAGICALGFVMLRRRESK